VKVSTLKFPFSVLSFDMDEKQAYDVTVLSGFPSEFLPLNLFETLTDPHET
jgi:hypothetical protein